TSLLFFFNHPSPPSIYTLSLHDALPIFVRNNIFAFGRDHQLQRTRPEPHPSFSFETNIAYFDSGELLAGDWSNDNYQMDWNIYRSEEHTSELQSRFDLVCRLLLEKKKKK